MAVKKRRNWRFNVEPICLALGSYLILSSALAQGLPSGVPVSFPTFTGSFNAAGKQYQYRLAGRSPDLGGTTTIPTVLVPVSLSFDAYPSEAGKKLVISSAADVPKVVESPIFQKFGFATGDTQYGDAVERAEFYPEAAAKRWHTLLGQPRVTRALDIEIPAADGYVLTSKRTGNSLAVVDLEFVQRKLFKSLGNMQVRPDELVIALTKDVEFYPLDDATVCCSWGSHGVQLDASSKHWQPFILGSYLQPGVVPGYSDIQPLTEQLAEWLNDPLQGYQANTFPAWLKPPDDRVCEGRGEGSSYRFEEPTDGEARLNSTLVIEHGSFYHLENAALLSWFAESPSPDTFRHVYSFPGAHVLNAPARPCLPRFRARFSPTASPLPETHAHSGHELIGYWVGYSPVKTIPLKDVSPQWDVVIVAFAPPAKGSTSLMEFRTPAGYTEEQFKAEIRQLQDKGKKVLISLGGGGQVVTLNTTEDLGKFVGSVSAIVQQYAFNGIDLDFETPSLMLDPGDTNFRKPTTPSIVHLIVAMRRLRQRFGPKFMIAEVPEGPQVPAGMEVYAGQFGSFLPVIYGTRNILSFVDVQNYNTPPLEGLDGNYYMPETADYYVSMTEMLLEGFAVARNPKQFFPPLSPEKVAVGFLVGRSPIHAMEASVRYLVEGKTYPGREYQLRRPDGYRDFDGVMFWNIQADWRDNYRMSNSVGPLLHGFPPAGASTPAESRRQ
ncbi:MAG TPA: glycosyl hydrolase family 18 protein [Terriglobia bacterium]|nr:glycosyl hydrolase family 18 protein [Terriglobia bacterium]